MNSSMLEKVFFSENNLCIIAEKILRASGYKIMSFQNLERHELTPRSYTVDITAKLAKIAYFVDIKASTTLQFRNLAFLEVSIQKLVEMSDNNNAIPVLMIFAIVSEKDKEKYKQLYGNLIIVDLPNILSATQGTSLQSELIGLLPFSVEHVEYKKGDMTLGWTESSHPTVELIEKLDNCVAGKSGAVNFEDICYEVLRYTLSDDLSLWSRQAKSNKNLYRFDLLCRIKDNTGKTVWSMLERFFNSKYLVFEFKNYNQEITQKEIYTTEKYLYSKALRSVAFIIARNGFDENARHAAAGCLREEGKLIALLTIENIKEMFELKKKQEDPTEILLRTIDDLLIHLEK